MGWEGLVVLFRDYCLFFLFEIGKGVEECFSCYVYGVIYYKVYFYMVEVVWLGLFVGIYGYWYL